MKVTIVKTVNNNIGIIPREINEEISKSINEDNRITVYLYHDEECTKPIVDRNGVQIKAVTSGIKQIIGFFLIKK